MQDLQQDIAVTGTSFLKLGAFSIAFCKEFLYVIPWKFDRLFSRWYWIMGMDGRTWSSHKNFF